MDLPPGVQRRWELVPLVGKAGEGAYQAVGEDAGGAGGGEGLVMTTNRARHSVSCAMHEWNALPRLSRFCAGRP